MSSRPVSSRPHKAPTSRSSVGSLRGYRDVLRTATSSSVHVGASSAALMNKAYTDIIRARIAAAIGEANALRAISHDGLLGALRETVVRQLLVPLLPLHIASSTGVVTSFNGEQSRQCDIVLYDRRVFPPILLSEAGLFPVEAVLACIEVKSCLDIDEVRKAHECATSVRNLPITSGIHDIHDRPQPHATRPPLTALFAFATNLRKASDLDRYLDFCSEFEAGQEPIGVICVVGAGCWISTPKGWVIWAGEMHEEVLGFLVCLSNTLPEIAASRGEPRLGGYLRNWEPRVYSTRKEKKGKKRR